MSMTTTINGQPVVIRDVWADTLEEEMELIRNAVALTRTRRIRISLGVCVRVFSWP